MPRIMILGPYLDAVREPEPGTVPPGLAGIRFLDPPTLPGGRVRVEVEPTKPEDGVKRPVNIYAFFVPIEKAIEEEDRTTGFFFDGQFSNGSINVVPDRDAYEIKAAGVKPGAYLVQTILEYQAD